MAVHKIFVQGQSTMTGKIMGSKTTTPTQQQCLLAQQTLRLHNSSTHLHKARTLIYQYIYIHGEILNGMQSLASLHLLTLAARQ